MRGLAAGFANEAGKLFARKKTPVSLAIIAAGCAASGLLWNHMRGISGMSAAQTPFLLLSIATGYALPMLAFMAVSDCFTSEQENGSIQASFTKPVSRLSVFVSKILAVELYVALALGVCLAGSAACALLLDGALPPRIGEVCAAYAVSLAPALPVILFAVFLSQLASSSTAAMALSVSCFLGLRAVCLLMPGLFPMAFISYTGWYAMFIGAGMPAASICNAAVLLSAYGLIFFALALWLFERKEC